MNAILNYLLLISITGSVTKVNSTHISGVSSTDTRTVDINAGEHTNDDLVVLRVF